MERLRRMALLVGAFSLIASLPGLLTAGLAAPGPEDQARATLAWQPALDPGQQPGPEPRRSAPTPVIAFAPRAVLAECSNGSLHAGRRAFLACRRGGEDIPLPRRWLFRRMGGADEPDSPAS